MEQQNPSTIALPETMPSLKEVNKANDEFVKLAAQCWCDDTTKDCEMDIKLAEVFARVLEEQVGKERLRIVTLILEQQDRMIAEYRNVIKHTGGLLTKSMVYAFSKALNEVFKLINTTKRNP